MADEIKQLTIPDLPEGNVYIVLSPGTIETGFQAAVYNRIIPANIELRETKRVKYKTSIKTPIQQAATRG